MSGSKLRTEHWDKGYCLQPSVVLNAQPDDEIVTME
jgi:hypothetical protein